MLTFRFLDGIFVKMGLFLPPLNGIGKTKKIKKNKKHLRIINILHFAQNLKSKRPIAISLLNLD